MRSSYFAYIVLFLFGWSELLCANQITKVSGAKVLIQVTDLDVKSGQDVYALDESGKKKAILRIDKIRGDRATANIIKGKAKSGYYVEVKSKGGGGSARVDQDRDSSIKDSRLGLLLGITQNTMNVNLSSASYNLSGSAMVVAGFWDIPLSEGLFARGKVGVKQFSTQMGSIKAEFQYLGLEGSLNFKLGNTFWLGGGGAFLFSMSKSSNVPGLDVSAATNSFFFGGLGANFRLGRSSTIPVSLDYAMYPSGTGVSASAILIRAGYAFDL